MLTLASVANLPCRSVEYVHPGYHPQRTVLRGLFDHATLNLSHSWRYCYNSLEILNLALLVIMTKCRKTTSRNSL
jgi:hypothetical protein